MFRRMAAVSPGGVWQSVFLGRLVTASGIALLYYLLALLSYAHAARPSEVVVVWLPSGLLLGLLLLLDRSLWVYALSGALLGNLGADLQRVGMYWWGFAGAAVNGVESLFAAWLVRRHVRDRLTFGTVRDVLGFFGLAIVVANGATALAGALVLARGEYSALLQNWLHWWIGDGMGMLMVAPLLVTGYEALRSRAQLTAARVTELVVSLVLFGGLTALLLYVSPDLGIWHPAFLLLPLLMVLAVRSGPAGAAAGVFIVYAVATGFGAYHVQNFAPPGAHHDVQVISMSAFLVLVSISTLLTASLLSERQRAIAELQDSETRLREMAEHIQEAFFSLELPSGRPLYVSPGWATIAGQPIAAGHDRASWSDPVLEEDRDRVLASQAANARGQATSVTFRIRRPDGMVRLLRARTYPVRDATGVICRVVGTAEDITDTAATEERLHQAEKLEAVGNLAGGIAHDFNNILTIILSYSGLLLQDETLSEDQREQLDAIRQAGDSAAALTRQLLIFSRRQAVQPQDLSLNERVTGMGKLLRRLLPENITLTIAADAQPDRILADSTQVEQVIVNLAVNARDAMPSGGTLRMETHLHVDAWQDDAGAAESDAQHLVVLEVSDTGTGIDDATRARMFEPFFTTKARGRGTGLGLSTVHGIVTACGGWINVESTPGRGTTFRVYFPRASAEAITEAASSASAAPRGTETVMVVEDDNEVRAILHDVLVGYGYQVRAFADASDALRWIISDRSPVHLLLTDVMLPGMGGHELADVVAELYPGIRVLFISGYSEAFTAEAASAVDRANFLQKPFTAGRLGRRVREVLDLRD